ncbi:MAG: ACP S-malonyltransferase [Holosporales bacterium]|jgi:[acyl-carrier-protein] S-malonyltransferase|nr:ACP S-malonyltransferase [Holosporales bacterium]
MNRISTVFPGQGVQKPGMGQWLYDNFSSAKLLFEEVNDALEMNLSNIMFCEEHIEQLKFTQNAQPAIMAVGMAALRVLANDFGLKDFAYCTAGHSLGEYTALIAAGMFSVQDGARLLQKRGLAMQSAVPAGVGGMLAVLGIDDITLIEKIAVTATEKAGLCEVANDNCPGQCVLSGYKAALEFAGDLAKENGAKKIVPLDVSVPSHCSLMAPAAKALKAHIMECRANNISIPLIQNYTAQEEIDTSAIINNLAAQITGRVRWRESILSISSMKAHKIIEVGPGSVLKGLIKRTTPDIEVLSINSTVDLECVATIISN